jgi:hypothetical protein
MINFRFHVVSLTAVLLALGIGLVLGTTFLDDATVDRLERQLVELEENLDREGDRNAELQRRLQAFEEEASGLDEQLGERLLSGQLDGDAVLVVAPRGLDGDVVDRVTTALDQADADVAGVWWLTERLVLDDDEEVADLAEALDLSTDDADRLRANLAMQLADVLYGAADLPEQPEAGAPIGPGVADAVAEPAAAEPEVVARLREAGFVEYDPPEDGDDVVRLPASGLRIVALSGPGASLPTADALLPVLTALTSDGPAPVVAVDPSRQPDDGSGDGSPPDRLVDAIRGDDELQRRVSTVDDLDRVAGRVATVLALVDARPGDPRIGHYGMDEGTTLLPPGEDADA